MYPFQSSLNLGTHVMELIKPETSIAWARPTWAQPVNGWAWVSDFCPCIWFLLEKPGYVGVDINKLAQPKHELPT